MAGEQIGFVAQIIVDATADYRFCLANTNGTIANGSCTTMSGIGDRLPELLFDGTEFRAYVAQGDNLRRWRFDSSGGLLAEQDLWSDPATTRSVHMVLGTPSMDTVLTRGDNCGSLYLHHYESNGGHTVQQLQPEGLEARTELFEFSENSAGTRVALFRAQCLVDGGAACDVGQSSFMTLLASLSDDGGFELSPVYYPWNTSVAVSHFGNEVTTVSLALGLVVDRYVDGSSDAVGVRFESDTTLEFQFVGASRALGKNDYAVVYEGVDTGPEKHFLRFSLED